MVGVVKSGSEGGVGSRSGRINQSPSLKSNIVIGLFFRFVSDSDSLVFTGS